MPFIQREGAMYGDTRERPPSRGPVDDDLVVGMEYDVTTKYESSAGSKEHAVRQFLARHPLGVDVGSLLTQISSATVTTMIAPVQIHGGGPSGPLGGGGPPGGAGGQTLQQEGADHQTHQAEQRMYLNHKPQ